MYCLFVDLDGVLVDFDRGVQQVTGSLPADLHPRAMWPRLARTRDFYSMLEWREEGRLLWDGVQDRNPTILTGLPMGKWAEPQKREWCARELGPDVPVIACMSRDKPIRAAEATPKGSIPVLIDDRDRIRVRFEAAGGVFIHYQNTNAALAELDTLHGEFRPALL